MADTATSPSITADFADGHTPTEIARYMVVYYAILFSIVWYDWVILLSKEHRKIWRAEWSLAKVAYLLNRYCMLALTIVVFAGLGMNRETSGCKSLLGWQNAFPVLVYFFSGFILILRCYAIWGRSKIVAGVLCALHFSHVAVSGWTVVQAETLRFDGKGPCIPKDTLIMSAFYTCFTALVFDFVASGLALWRSCMVKKQYNAAGISSTVMDNIVRNGTLYIVGTVLATCFNMAFRFLSARNFDTPMEGYAGGNLCVAMGSILASRLALSLKIDEPDSKSSSHLLSSSCNNKDGIHSHTSSRTYKASRGSKTIGQDSGTGVSQVAVTISTQTCVDSPSIGEREKKIWLEDEDVELQSLDSRAGTEHRGVVRQ